MSLYSFACLSMCLFNKRSTVQVPQIKKEEKKFNSRKGAC